MVVVYGEPDHLLIIFLFCYVAHNFEKIMWKRFHCRLMDEHKKDSRKELKGIQAKIPARFSHCVHLYQ